MPEVDGALKSLSAVSSAASLQPLDLGFAESLNASPDGIVILNAAGRVMFLNKVGEILTGYEFKELAGRDFAMLAPVAAAFDVSRALDTQDCGPALMETSILHRHGEMIPVEMTRAPLGVGSRTICYFRDLRARRDVEQRLGQAQSDLIRIARVGALNDMGSALAHEINQPMTALMLYLQTAKAAMAFQPGTQGAGEELLAKALREANRAVAIIQRMRQFVTRRPTARCALDVPRLIDDTIELAFIGRSPAPLVRRICAEILPETSADPVQIEQVLVNLLKNAAEAAPEGKRADITISVRADDDTLYISVADNGPGISAELLPNLFKTFAPTRKPKGMGMGLAISRTIAQNHGGNLTVEPGGKGAGANFTLTLPVSEPVTRSQLSAARSA